MRYFSEDFGDQMYEDVSWTPVFYYRGRLQRPHRQPPGDYEPLGRRHRRDCVPERYRGPQKSDGPSGPAAGRIQNRQLCSRQTDRPKRKSSEPVVVSDDPDFRFKVRIIHNLIRSCHHLNNISGLVPPPMIRKTTDFLTGFIRPAFPNEDTQALLQDNAHDWQGSAIRILRSHYEQTMDFEVQDLFMFPSQEWRGPFQVATNWARRNLGHRLKEQTLLDTEAFIKAHRDLTPHTETPPACDSHLEPLPPLPPSGVAKLSVGTMTAQRDRSVDSSPLSPSLAFSPSVSPFSPLPLASPPFSPPHLPSVLSSPPLPLSPSRPSLLSSLTGTADLTPRRLTRRTKMMCGSNLCVLKEDTRIALAPEENETVGDPTPVSTPAPADANLSAGLLHAHLPSSPLRRPPLPMDSHSESLPLISGVSHLQPATHSPSVGIPAHGPTRHLRSSRTLKAQERRLRLRKKYTYVSDSALT